jgi:hypothetical protein
VQEPLECKLKHDTRFDELPEQSNEQLERHLADLEVVAVETAAKRSENFDESELGSVWELLRLEIKQIRESQAVFNQQAVPMLQWLKIATLNSLDAGRNQILVVVGQESSCLLRLHTECLAQSDQDHFERTVQLLDVFLAIQDFLDHALARVVDLVTRDGASIVIGIDWSLFIGCFFGCFNRVLLGNDWLLLLLLATLFNLLNKIFDLLLLF